MVPVAVACAPSEVDTVPSLFETVCKVSVKFSSGSTVASPLIWIVTVAEAWPAGIVPLNANGTAAAPLKSAALAAAEVSWPLKLTSPAVPPVRSTVKVKAVVPALPSAWETETEPAAKATVCGGVPD